jgi:hypothetical protein
MRVQPRYFGAFLFVGFPMEKTHGNLEVGESFNLPDRGLWEKVRDDWIVIEDYARESGKKFVCSSSIEKDKPGTWWEFTVQRVK